MGVTLTGDWNQLQKIGTRIERNFDRYADAVTKQGAQGYLDALKHRITAQDMTNASQWRLSPSYARKKKDNTDKVWINKGKFISLLEVRKLAKNMYFAGAAADKKYNKNDSMADIAFFGEYGTKTESPKPLFLPARLDTAQNMFDHVMDETQHLIADDGYSPRKEKRGK